ncbi:P2X purinoceptor 7-like [Dendronephthya gigantea]|uniref:P2X purinoceptor 7-like n=1 Tax=Dendronephthya gigantea TaxID=151771 RepID=UPI00106C0755|nr:P2X purinoceptor 7-like [Dendronephthya gigantea]
MEYIHENQRGEVLPYQFEPEPASLTGDNSDESYADESSDSASSSEENVEHEFERANAWRLQNLSWCKCGHCALSTKAVECFCCHEKALEYDEYEVLLDKAEAQGEKCLTAHPEFIDNMLSESVLKIDVCQYLEENWPLSDGDLERVHKLYRLVAYRRCSRWIFQILGKGKRRPFPSCVYSSIRGRFASSDGIYTHFKYAKKSKR